MAPRITVESWDPEYGTPLGTETLEPSDATIDPDVELPASEWRPLDPGADARHADRVFFIDGVRRIDAFVWITDEDGSTRPGICASYAAGLVVAGDMARVERVEVRRGLFARNPLELTTRLGVYGAYAVAGDDPEQLSLALQQRLSELEAELVSGSGGNADLVIRDGPQRASGAVGYIKTHRVAYLDDELAQVVGKLTPGQRTPLFVTTTSWSRYSWYLRLPGPVAHPWSGVVRLEVSADVSTAEAMTLADCTAVTLPRYASTPHKDPRAPQNLFPIAGLERQLRHRLGDAALMHRALRVAAGS